MYLVQELSRLHPKGVLRSSGQAGWQRTHVTRSVAPPDSCKNGGSACSPWREAERRCTLSLVLVHLVLLSFEVGLSRITRRAGRLRLQRRLCIPACGCLTAPWPQEQGLRHCAALHCYHSFCLLSRLRCRGDGLMWRLGFGELKYLAQVYTIGDFFPSFVPCLSSSFSFSSKDISF